MTTERDIRAAIAKADRVLAGGAQLEYPRELFPEVARRDRRGPVTALAAAAVPEPANAPHARPVTSAAEAELTPERVGAWSAELGFAQATAKVGRVTRAND